MQFNSLLKQFDLIDIVTVDDTHYAITASAGAVPGCVSVPAAQLHTRVREFLERGYSHRYRQSYRVIAGVASWALVTYSLERLPPSRKQVFSHALMGVQGRAGLLSQWGGQKIGRSAFLVPIDREHDALAFLAHWAVDYTREVMLRA